MSTTSDSSLQERSPNTIDAPTMSAIEQLFKDTADELYAIEKEYLKGQLEKNKISKTAHDERRDILETAFAEEQKPYLDAIRTTEKNHLMLARAIVALQKLHLLPFKNRHNIIIPPGGIFISARPGIIYHEWTPEELVTVIASNDDTDLALNVLIALTSDLSHSLSKDEFKMAVATAAVDNVQEGVLNEEFIKQLQQQQSEPIISPIVSPIVSPDQPELVANSNESTQISNRRGINTILAAGAGLIAGAALGIGLVLAGLFAPFGAGILGIMALAVVIALGSGLISAGLGFSLTTATQPTAEHDSSKPDNIPTQEPDSLVTMAYGLGAAVESPAPEIPTRSINPINPTNAAAKNLDPIQDEMPQPARTPSIK